MTDEFKVTYEIEDGYVGGARPQHTSIPESEIDDDMSVKDIEIVFYEWIYEDMLQKVNANGDPSDFVEWAQAVIASRKDA